jgi:hypothetical protein
MSTTDMVTACGLTLRRAGRKAVSPRTSLWTYSVHSAVGEELFTGTMRDIKTWLRREGYVA